jgi:two-component system, response regulator PdtaR
MPDHEDSRILPLHRPPLVLVVAENADHRSGVTRIVRKLGFSVRECACAEAAWAYLDRRGDAVRLLLTDVALAGLDGYALAERAAELNPRLETVVMAMLRGPQLDELIDQIPFVSRPVQPGELAHVLEAVVGLPQEPAPMPRIPRPIVARRRRPGRRRVP